VNLLLDTHVLIWWDEGGKLTVRARRAIEAADTVYMVTRDPVFGLYALEHVEA
jgi:PIN domain nuclease of toxin-antitoxin system